MCKTVVNDTISMHKNRNITMYKNTHEIYHKKIHFLSYSILELYYQYFA